MEMVLTLRKNLWFKSYGNFAEGGILPIGGVASGSSWLVILVMMMMMIMMMMTTKKIMTTTMTTLRTTVMIAYFLFCFFGF